MLRTRWAADRICALAAAERIERATGLPLAVAACRIRPLALERRGRGRAARARRGADLHRRRARRAARAGPGARAAAPARRAAPRPPAASCSPRRRADVAGGGPCVSAGHPVARSRSATLDVEDGAVDVALPGGVRVVGRPARRPLAPARAHAPRARRARRARARSRSPRGRCALDGPRPVARRDRRVRRRGGRARSLERGRCTAPRRRSRACGSARRGDGAATSAPRARPRRDARTAASRDALALARVARRRRGQRGASSREVARRRRRAPGVTATVAWSARPDRCAAAGERRRQRCGSRRGDARRGPARARRSTGGSVAARGTVRLARGAAGRGRGRAPRAPTSRRCSTGSGSRGSVGHACSSTGGRRCPARSRRPRSRATLAADLRDLRALTRLVTVEAAAIPAWSRSRAAGSRRRSASTARGSSSTRARRHGRPRHRDRGRGASTSPRTRGFSVRCARAGATSTRSGASPRSRGAASRRMRGDDRRRAVRQPARRRPRPRRAVPLPRRRARERRRATSATTTSCSASPAPRAIRNVSPAGSGEGVVDLERTPAARRLVAVRGEGAAARPASTRSATGSRGRASCATSSTATSRSPAPRRGPAGALDAEFEARLGDRDVLRPPLRLRARGGARPARASRRASTARSCAAAPASCGATGHVGRSRRRSRGTSTSSFAGVPLADARAARRRGGRARSRGTATLRGLARAPARAVRRERRRACSRAGVALGTVQVGGTMKGERLVVTGGARRGLASRARRASPGACRSARARRARARRRGAARARAARPPGFRARVAGRRRPRRASSPTRAARARACGSTRSQAGYADFRCEAAGPVVLHASSRGRVEVAGGSSLRGTNTELARLGRARAPSGQLDVSRRAATLDLRLLAGLVPALHRPARAARAGGARRRHARERRSSSAPAALADAGFQLKATSPSPSPALRGDARVLAEPGPVRRALEAP